MNYEYFIARKVASGKKKSFTRLIIRIAITAIALSMTVMICSNALISGFKKEISEKMFGFWGHIHITANGLYKEVIEDEPLSIDQPFYPDLLKNERLDYLERFRMFGTEFERMAQTKGGIRHIQVFAISSGIIKAKEDIEGIILKGAGKDYNWDFLQNYIKEGKALSWQDSTVSNEILISRQTSDRLKLNLDDRIRIAFLKGEELIERSFKVVGVYQTGLEEFDRRFAIVDIRKIQQLMGWKEDQVGGFEVFLDHMDDMDAISTYLYYTELSDEKYKDNFYTETIVEKESDIFQWLSLQDINEIVILSLMTLVAIINMITALLILILERTNMIGILKALGSSNWSIRKVFLYYAAYIIVLGIAWGNAIGITLCLLQQKFKFIKLDETNYYLEYAPIDLKLWTVLLINIATLLVVLAFLIIPSYLVTRISPIRSIRFK